MWNIMKVNYFRFHAKLPGTTSETASIIRNNLDKSPLYKGDTGTGPRYCPSIEDKIVKFGDKDGHRIYLEPEGVDTDEWYINGFSTSLPFDVQYKEFLEQYQVLKM